MSNKAHQNLRIDGGRLMKDIHSTAQWGKGEVWGSASTETGMARLSLSSEDKLVRDWFVEVAKSLSCNVHIDAMGNIFAVRPGRNNGPATFIGSHLDTQPNGGRYDGILGVLAGLEILKVLEDNKVETAFPIGVVNWTNEEGARFPTSMVSSGVWAGSIPIEKAHNLKEVGGGFATMKDELQRIGYLGDIPASYKNTPFAAHFELHIEQGPILEAENKKIGIVKGVQAYRWHTITVRGRDCHTGATTFPHRSDALLTAARMISHSHVLASEFESLASTGVLTLKPGSTNTVPGEVKFSLDIRSGSDSQLERLENKLKEDFEIIAKDELLPGTTRTGVKGRGCSIEWQLDSTSTATTFNETCIQCLSDSAKDAAAEASVAAEDFLKEGMISGAGHDSVYTSKRCPTAMVFIPCKDGISHNPTEYSSPEECATGAQVLLGAVLRFDELRAAQAS
ncbi:hypothetical protein B0O99DRAFT_530042 [Bisporella sp. PMI_857]|nr:hypothetical protein B0O99DRAFT_530042 [Bisporella sp. PMI_857]